MSYSIPKIPPNFCHMQVKTKYRQFLFCMILICMNGQLPHFSLISQAPNNTVQILVTMIYINCEMLDRVQI